MDPDEAKRRGYCATPGGQQWCPGPRRAVDKSRWKPCDVCGRLIPVVADGRISPYTCLILRPRTSDRDGTSSDAGGWRSGRSGKRGRTWTYVCPYCGHCHVGTPNDTYHILDQTACHDCGTDLGDAYQCPKCSFPRGWMTVQCPFCGNRQPVEAPHWVVGCDTFHLECVKCESVFDSFCIC